MSRQHTLSPALLNKWIVLDGSIDSKYMDGLNPVLEENGVMTLASLERVPIPAYVKFLFETDTLQHLSPTTLTRTAILRMDNTEVAWQSYITSWVKKKYKTFVTQHAHQFEGQQLPSARKAEGGADGGEAEKKLLSGKTKGNLAEPGGFDPDGPPMIAFPNLWNRASLCSDEEQDEKGGGRVVR